MFTYTYIYIYLLDYTSTHAAWLIIFETFWNGRPVALVSTSVASIVPLLLGWARQSWRFNWRSSGFKPTIFCIPFRIVSQGKHSYRTLRTMKQTTPLVDFLPELVARLSWKWLMAATQLPKKHVFWLCCWCTFIYIYISLSFYQSIYLSIYLCIYVCIYIYICICVCVCVCVCMYDIKSQCSVHKIAIYANKTANV